MAAPRDTNIIFDALKDVIQDLDNVVGTPITNLNGNIVSGSLETTPVRGNSWLVTTPAVGFTTIPSLVDLANSIALDQPGNITVVIPPTASLNSVLTYQPSRAESTQTLLFTTTAQILGPTEYPITIEADGYEIAVYINRVKVGVGAEALICNPTLSAGRQTIMILLHGGNGPVQITTRSAIQADATVTNPTPPQWVGGIVENATDLTADHLINTLTWHNDPFATKWTVYRASTTSAGIPGVSSITDNSDGTYDIVFAGQDLTFLKRETILYTDTFTAGWVLSTSIAAGDTTIVLMRDDSSTPFSLAAWELKEFYYPSPFVSVGEIGYETATTIIWEDSNLTERSLFVYKITSKDFLTGAVESPFSVTQAIWLPVTINNNSLQLINAFVRSIPFVDDAPGPAGIAETIRPVTPDIDTSGWTTPPLFSKINQTSPSDTLFVSSTVSDSICGATTPHNFRVTLGLVSGTPQGSDKQTLTVRSRARKVLVGGPGDGTFDFRVQLREAGVPTAIATFEHPGVGTSFTQFNDVLTNTEFDSIVDHDALSLEFTATICHNVVTETIRADVSWTEVEYTAKTPVERGVKIDLIIDVGSNVDELDLVVKWDDGSPGTHSYTVAIADAARLRLRVTGGDTGPDFFMREDWTAFSVDITPRSKFDTGDLIGQLITLFIEDTSETPAGAKYELSPGVVALTDFAVPGINVTFGVDGNGRVQINATPPSGSIALDDVTDVTITAVTTNEVLVKSAGDWINQTLAEAGISAVGHAHTNIPLGDASDVTIGGITTGEILVKSAGDWINQTLAEAGISAVGHTHPSIAVDDLSDVTSPSALEGQMLRKSAGNWLSVGTLTMRDNGTATNPTYAFLNSANTGMFRQAANVLGFAANTIEVMRLASTLITTFVNVNFNGDIRLIAGSRLEIDNAAGDDFVVIDNVGSVGVSRLRLAGQTIINEAGGQISSADGTVSNPTYSFVTDDSMGMRKVGTDLGLTNDGVDMLLIGAGLLVVTADLVPSADGFNSVGLTGRRWGNIWTNLINGVAPTFGTVTSIGITAGALIDVTGSPVTSSGNITIDVDLSELPTSTSSPEGDFFVVVDNINVQRKLTKANINLSGMNNDAGWTTNVGTVTAVSGGVGIDSTGGTTPSLSFNASELGVGGTLVGGDWLVAANAAVSNRQLISNIPLSIFNNDLSIAANQITAGTFGAGTYTFTGGLLAVSGTFSALHGLAVTTRLQPGAAQSASIVRIAGTIDEAATLTHVDLMGLEILAPVITAGAAAVTNATSLKIVAAPNASGATNRALWVASGISEFGGQIQVTNGSHIIPLVDSTTDLGSNLNRWANLYVDAITLTNALLLPDGTAADPAFSFSSNPDTGMYLIGTNQLGFATFNTLRMSLDGNEMVVTTPLRVSDGTGPQPAYAFESAPGVGFYLVAPTVIGLGGNADLIPEFDSDSDLGSTTLRWANIWVDLINGAAPGTGTVTSIGITPGNLIDVTDSPVTGAGSITVDVDLSELTTSTADTDGDFFVVVDSVNAQRKLTKANITFPAGQISAGTFAAGNFTFPADLTVTSVLRVLATGHHAIGTGTSTQTQLRIAGVAPTGTRQAIDLDTTVSPPSGIDGAILLVDGTLTEFAGAGTHVNMSGSLFAIPTFIAGTHAVTNASTVKIVGQPTAVGATNRALWVAAGLSEFNGTVLFTDGTAPSPGIAFASETGLGLRRSSAGIITLEGNLTVDTVLIQNGGALLAAASSQNIGAAGTHWNTIYVDNIVGVTIGTVTAVTGGVGIDSTGGNTPAISFNASELSVGGTLVGGDWLVAANAAVSNRQLISNIPLSIFNNNVGWTTNVGTVTSVAGGTGIASTGGATPSLSLTVDELAEKTGAVVGTDRLVGTTGTTNWAETISGIPLSIFDNDLPGASFPIFADNGTEANPSYSFTNATGIGLWRQGANTLGLAGALHIPDAALHSVGGTFELGVQWVYKGTLASGAATAIGLRMATRLQPGSTQDAYLIDIDGTLDENAAATAHPNFAALLVRPPTITAGTATITNATTLKVVNAPTAGVNNRALWVETGLTEVDDLVITGSILAATSAGGRYGFSEETNMGMERSAAGVLTFRAAGIILLQLSSAGFVQVAAPVRANNGSGSTPAYSFTTDPGLGFYRKAAAVMGLGGGDLLPETDSNWDLGSTTVRWANLWVDNINGSPPGGGAPDFPLLAPNGAVGAPSYSFSGDTDTGMWLNGVGQLNLTVAGTARVNISSGLEQHNGGSYDFQDGIFKSNWFATGLTQELIVQNTSTGVNANTHTRVRIASTNAVTGDPYLLLSILGERDYYFGIDNSDGDSLKIGGGPNVGTDAHITITAAGAITLGQADVTIPGGNLLVTGGNLVVSGTGPHAIGGAADSRYALSLRGSFSGATTRTEGFVGFQALTGVSGNTIAIGLMRLQGTVTTQAVVEVVTDVYQLFVGEPNISLGAGSSVTNATTLKISGAPTEGVVNRALWVTSGQSDFGGRINTMTGSAGSVAIGIGGDSNTGFFWAGTNTIGFAADGGERMSISGTAISIGVPVTISGGASGALTLASGGTGEKSIVVNNDGGSLFIGLDTSTGGRFLGSSAFSAFFGTTGARVVELATNNNVRVRIGTDGLFSVLAAPIRAINGSAGAPSYSFTGDIDTGMYLDVVGQLGFSIGGIQLLEMRTDGGNHGLFFQNTATNDSFLDWGGTGISQFRKITDAGGLGIGADSSIVILAGDTLVAYLTGAGIVAGTGVETLHLASDGEVVINPNQQSAYSTVQRFTFRANGQLCGPVGAAATPTFSFEADSNTGMYRFGSDELAFATGAAVRLQLTATRTLSIPPFWHNGNGTEGAPSYAWANNSNAGMYRVSSNVVGFAIQGVKTTSILTSGADRFINSDAGQWSDNVWTNVAETRRWHIGYRGELWAGTTERQSIRYFYHNGVGFQFVGAFSWNLGHGQLRMDNGHVTAPPFTFNDDVDTGMYLNSTAVLGWTLAGAQKMTLSAAQGLNIWNTESNNGIHLVRAQSDGQDIDIYVDDTTAWFRHTQDETASNIQLLSTNASGTAVAVLQHSVGNFLQWRMPNGTGALPAYSFAVDPDTGMWLNGAGTISFSVAGVEKIRIQANQMRIIDGTAALPAYSFINDNDLGMWRVGVDVLGLGGSVQIRHGGDEMLQLRHDSTTGNPFIAFKQQGTRRAFIQFANGGPSFIFDAEETGASILLRTQNVLRATINSTGISVVADVISNTSDRRLKKNIKPLTGALANILNWETFTYEYTKKATDAGVPEGQRIGLFAQDIQEHYPEAIFPAPFDDEYLTYDNKQVVPVLVAAIQELTARIEYLEAHHGIN